MYSSYYIDGTWNPITAFPVKDSQAKMDDGQSGLGPQGPDQSKDKLTSRAVLNDGDNISATASEMISQALCEACQRCGPKVNAVLGQVQCKYSILHGKVHYINPGPLYLALKVKA